MPKPNLGGQAVLEGLMMQTPEKMAIAVRCRNGSIVLLKDSTIHYLSAGKFGRIPVLRGIIAVMQSIFAGFRALEVSSKIFLQDAEKPDDNSSKTDLQQSENAPLSSLTAYIATIVFLITIYMLVIFPGSFLKILSIESLSTSALFPFYESLLSLVLIILYLLAISFIPEVYRTFQYHGAEHKVINAYEQNVDLSLDAIRQCSRFHPRCGTLFLFYSFIIGMLGFSFLPKDGPIWFHVLARIFSLPLILGFSFEFLAYLDKKSGRFAKFLVAPGLVIQNLTTREPEDTHLEVGLHALLALLEDSTFQ
ncbi:MAG: DUF1385 domain-containing protein [bacterium]